MYRKTDIFSEQKIIGNFLTQEFYTVLKSAQSSASYDSLFSTLIRDGAIFWKLKGHIR